MKKQSKLARSQTAGKPSGSADVDKYLAGIPEPARTTLNKIRAIIRSVLPTEATEGISYGMPAFKHKGPVAGYAAFPGHCAYFVMSGTLLDSFRNELKDYATSRGGIRFPVDKPLPAGLVRKLVMARMAQNERKK